MTVPVLTPRAAREQRTFRVLLDAMARPGTMAAVELSEFGGPCAAAITMLEALVDHEVTFAFSPRNASSEEAVLRLTGSRIAALHAADYIVADGAGIAEAINIAKEGQPEYPDRGATIIAMVSDVDESGEMLALSGPGINATRTIAVDGFDADLRGALAERNREIPMGLDLILLAPDGRFTCLTRYTRIREGA